MDDFVDFGIMATVLFLVFCALAAVVGGAVYVTASMSCTATAEKMGREHSFSIWTDCMVKTDKGEWIPLSQYRNVQIDEVKP